MSVHAHISLKKDVSDLDKADDWFVEVKAALKGKTSCRMDAHSSNREESFLIKQEPDNG